MELPVFLFDFNGVGWFRALNWWCLALMGMIDDPSRNDHNLRENRLDCAGDDPGPSTDDESSEAPPPPVGCVFVQRPQLAETSLDEKDDPEFPTVEELPGLEKGVPGPLLLGGKKV